MHDWTLKHISFDWASRFVRLGLSWDGDDYAIVAHCVSDLHIPQEREWGPSVSVNIVKGPYFVGNGRQELTVEMQSGDTISIIAKSFDMPRALYKPAQAPNSASDL